MEKPGKSISPVLKLVRWIGGALAACLLIAVFYVTVILIHPQTDLSAQVDMNQPLVSAGPAIALENGDLSALTGAFPVSVLGCAPGSMTLTDGLCCDAGFGNGLARVLTLTYLEGQSQTIRVTSIYPARAIPLLPGDGFHLVGAGPAVAGLSTVRMEGQGMVRLHLQTTDGLYAITAPMQSNEELSALLRPLQLLTTSSQ